jgi:hypothetical protein
MEDDLMKTLSRLFLFLVLLQQTYAQTVLVNDFPVSDVTNTSVYRPAVASAPNGSYAVTWGDERFGNTNRASGAGNIFGRIIGANGSPLTANFRVDDVVANTYYTDYWVFFSTPLFLPSGSLVVVWHVNGASGISGIQSNDVYYTAFNGTTGARLGAGVQLNKVGSATGGPATRPSVAFRSPSTFLAVYEYSKTGNNIGGTVVDIGSGTQLGDAFEMSESAVNNRIYPHVASNGNYTVCVWTDARTDPQGDIWSERIVGNTLASANVKVNDDPAGGYNQYARVAMDAQGNYVVVWIDTRANSSGDLYAQRFDAQGNKIGVNFKLTKSNSRLNEYPPGISMKSDGSFVVAWADSIKQAGKNWGIKTRFFGSAGQPLSDVIEVTTAPSLQPDVKIGPTGSVYYAWLDGRENANLGRVYSKVYAGFPTTSVEEYNTPLSFQLDQNYPNPFNPSTSIGYQLSTTSHVSLKVFDVLGRQIATLVDEQKTAGTYSARWDATNVPSGTYLYRLANEGHVAAKTMILMK